MEEAEKWIDNAKKGKNGMPITTPPSTIITLTLEEEQRRKTRTLQVRITGLKDIDNVEEEVKDLLKRMAIPEPTHTRAWRVGKRGVEGTSTLKKKALILQFPTGKAREFLQKRSILKKTRIFLGDDLTVAQIAHMKEKMPEILAAREKGKIAFYCGGRVVILETQTT